MQWKTNNIEDCIEGVRYPNKIQKKDFLEEGVYPIISQEQAQINGYWSNPEDLFKVNRPVVVFGDHTKVLKYIDFDFVLGADGVKILQPKDFLYPKYFYYYLLSNPIKSLGYARHYRLLKEMDISYPSLVSEQKRIVEILDEAFEGIDAAIANTEKNLANTRELFESTFKKLFSEWESGDKYSLSELLDKGWIVSHLDGNHGGDYPRKEEFLSSGIPYISANCIKEDRVDMGLAKFLSPERASLLRKGIAKDNDVLFAHNATVGPVALLKTDSEKIILGTSLTYYRCNTEKILPEYLAHYMRSPIFTKQYESIMRQSTRNQVPITRQREFFHIIPPVNVQRKLSDRLDNLFNEKFELDILYEKKISSLHELKQSLLQKAFRGELTSGEDALAEVAA